MLIDGLTSFRTILLGLVELCGKLKPFNTFALALLTFEATNIV